MLLVGESMMNPAPRKRRPHRKSRAGCRNCKLRRVKCDETRPACRNCSDLLVTCNYDASSSDVKSDTSYDGDLCFSVTAVKLVNDALVTVFNERAFPRNPQPVDAPQFRPLNRSDVDRLKRFHTRTVFTLGPPEICSPYKRYVSKEGTQYPFLLHAILAMTTMHDRYHQGVERPFDDCSMETQYYHLGRAAALFKDRLTKPCYKTADRNAIWITASLLSHMSASALKTWDHEKSWPLTTASDPHQDWFNMSQGLPVIYGLVSPTDPGGLFHELWQKPGYDCLRDKWNQDTRDGIDGIPFSFVSLCELSVSSNVENNPYHAAVRALVQIWDMEPNKFTAFRFMSFISLLRPEMKDLLYRKDPRALLLLAYWYTKMFDLHWWVHQRSVVECTAICVYLERYHSENCLLMDMLQCPLSRLEEFRKGILSRVQN